MIGAFRSSDRLMHQIAMVSIDAISMAGGTRRKELEIDSKDGGQS